MWTTHTRFAALILDVRVCPAAGAALREQYSGLQVNPACVQQRFMYSLYSLKVHLAFGSSCS